MARGEVRGALALLVALGMGEGHAAANAPAPFSRPTGAVPGVVVERPSPLAVEREDLLIDCARGGSPIHTSCTFVATYFLHNPTASEEEVVGAFYTAEHPSRESEDTEPRVTARLDGLDVRTDATDEQLARMDAIVREDPEAAQLSPGPQDRMLRRDPFAIAVAGGRRARLVFEGPLRPFRYGDHNPRDGYALQPIVTRHPIVASSASLAWDDSEDDYLYLISPVSRWAGDPEVHVEIRHYPENHVVTTSPRAGFTTVHERGVTIERAVVRASTRENLRFRVVYDPPLFHNGGPVFGIGPRIGREELRLRFGYEVGLRHNLVLGGSAETNFDDYVTGAATLDAATPSVFFIPSLAVGAGVPIQFRRGAAARAGVRGQFTIAWPLISLLFPIDFYPAENSSGSHFEGAFLTQLSF